ncbi:unnamed protein product [marine sediment metagenome]|uniref:Uncharacterized protein n=1 Tax=marine sediment metagenome TaxID=412755 RepID=X0SU58_9ZZZZ
MERPGDLDREARLADVGSLLLRGLDRLEAKKRPGLKLVKGSRPDPRRQPVRRDGAGDER